MAVDELLAAHLVIGSPQLGSPELTEVRIIRRAFPKDESERACYKFLLTAMQGRPDHPRGKKAEFEKRCRRQFHVTVESFDLCWREAINVTGARWDQPGRRRAQ